MIAVVRRLDARGLEGTAAALGYRKAGDEWRGPCPRCGGEDPRSDRAGIRAHRDDPAKALFSCRGCPDAAGLAVALTDRLGPEPRDPDWRPPRRSRRPPRRSPAPGAPPRSAPAPGARPAPAPDAGTDDAAIRRARDAWNAAEPAAPDSPPALHLVARSVLDAGAAPPTTAIRWIPRSRLDRLTRPTRFGPWPPKAAGAMLAAVRDPAGETCGIEVLPLDPGGSRFSAPDGGADRFSNGRTGSGSVRIPGSEPTGPLALVEGTADALAVVRAAGDRLRAAAALTGSAWSPRRIPPDAGPLVLVADADAPGRKAARSLRAALVAAGDPRLVATVRLPPGTDAAELAGTGRLDELRAAVLDRLPRPRQSAAATPDPGPDPPRSPRNRPDPPGSGALSSISRRSTAPSPALSNAAAPDPGRIAPIPAPTAPAALPEVRRRPSTGPESCPLCGAPDCAAPEDCF